MRWVSCIEEPVLAVVLGVVASVMVVMLKTVVVNTKTERAPWQGMEEGWTRGNKDAWVDAFWGAKKEEHASSITEP